MRFVCEQCKAKYSIPEEKIHGKTMRMSCRRCGQVLTVRGEGADAHLSAPPPSVEEKLASQVYESVHGHAPPAAPLIPKAPPVARVASSPIKLANPRAAAGGTMKPITSAGGMRAITASTPRPPPVARPMPPAIPKGPRPAPPPASDRPSAPSSSRDSSLPRPRVGPPSGSRGGVAPPSNDEIAFGVESREIRDDPPTSEPPSAPAADRESSRLAAGVPADGARMREGGPPALPATMPPKSDPMHDAWSDTSAARVSFSSMFVPLPVTSGAAAVVHGGDGVDAPGRPSIPEVVRASAGTRDGRLVMFLSAAIGFLLGVVVTAATMTSRATVVAPTPAPSVSIVALPSASASDPALVAEDFPEELEPDDAGHTQLTKRVAAPPRAGQASASAEPAAPPAITLLTQARADGFVARHLGTVRRFCAEKHAEALPASVRVILAITPEGTVSNVSINQTAGGAAVGECIRAMAPNWKFPKNTEGLNYTITLNY